MQLWYEKLGYEQNPLTYIPRQNDQLIEVSDLIDDILYHVESGNMVFIEGSQGLGKTAYLHKIIDRFGGKNKVIYFDCKSLSKSAQIDVLMKGTYGFTGKLFGTIPKDMIVLLDNVSSLTDKNAERVKYYFDQNYIRSLVFAGSSVSSLPLSIVDRIGRRVYKTRPLSKEGLSHLLTLRLGSESKIITPSVVEKLTSIAKGNPKKFLIVSDLVCRYGLKKGSHITDAHLKAVIGGSNVKSMV